MTQVSVPWEPIGLPRGVEVGDNCSPCGLKTSNSFSPQMETEAQSGGWASLHKVCGLQPWEPESQVEEGGWRAEVLGCPRCRQGDRDEGGQPWICPHIACFLEEVSAPAPGLSGRAMNYARKPQAWAGPS